MSDEVLIVLNSQWAPSATRWSPSQVALLVRWLSTSGGSPDEVALLASPDKTSVHLIKTNHSKQGHERFLKIEQGCLGYARSYISLVFFVCSID